MKDKSILLLFTSSLIVLAAVIFLLGVFVRPKILDMGTPLFVANINKTSELSPKNNYNIYPEINGDNYLIKFTNVICDGAMGPDTRENAIFRISFTLESKSNYLHQNISENEKTIIRIVRDVMSKKSIDDMTGENKLKFFKAEVKNNLNKWLPDAKVSEIYVEGIVGQ